MHFNWNNQCILGVGRFIPSTTRCPVFDVDVAVVSFFDMQGLFSMWNIAINSNNQINSVHLVDLMVKIRGVNYGNLTTTQLRVFRKSLRIRDIECPQLMHNKWMNEWMMEMSWQQLKRCTSNSLQLHCRSLINSVRMFNIYMLFGTWFYGSPPARTNYPVKDARA